MGAVVEGSEKDKTTGAFPNAAGILLGRLLARERRGRLSGAI